MTLMMCACVAGIAAAIGVDESGRWLAAIVSEALSRANVTQDYVSVCTRIPAARLSDQLAGKIPFTGLCRILSNPQIRRETDFWPVLTDLFADEVDRALVPRDIGTLLARVEALLEAPPCRREVNGAHAAQQPRHERALTKAGV